ncbi:MAG TPA: hypothetical protein VF529_06840 [Solirubrobacteraceae bacterium]|jgi:hypothetical protein
MSKAHWIASAVLALNSGDPTIGIHRDHLRELTLGEYRRTGATGALLGFRFPWMVKRGEMRFLSEHGRRRLGV